MRTIGHCSRLVFFFNKRNTDNSHKNTKVRRRFKMFKKIDDQNCIEQNTIRFFATKNRFFCFSVWSFFLNRKACCVDQTSPVLRTVKKTKENSLSHLPLYRREIICFEISLEVIIRFF